MMSRIKVILMAATMVATFGGAITALNNKEYQSRGTEQVPFPVAEPTSSDNQGTGVEPTVQVPNIPNVANRTGELVLPSPSPADVSKLRKGSLALDLTVTPTCARHGQTITAVLKAVPGAQVSMIVSYADGQSFSTWYVGPVTPDGSVTYTWVVPAEAEPGEGYVFAAGHDPATDRNGTTAATFRVADKKRC